MVIITLILAWGGSLGCSSEERVVDVPVDVGPNPQNEFCMDCHGDSDLLKELIPHEDEEEEGEETEDG